MNSIERRLASITEDRRADYLFETKRAAAAVGCHQNKFHDWWHRTKWKLENLFIDQPGETAAELASLIAAAESRRQLEKR